MKKVRRRHSGSQKSKTKILFRIAFVVVAAAAITALTILLGTHLKQKAASAETAASVQSEQSPGAGRSEKVLPNGVRAEKNDPDLSVCAADLDISAVSENDLIDRIYTLPDFYDSVSIRVTRNGSLLYGSPAVQALVRETPPSPEADPDSAVPSFTALKDIVTVALQKGYRVSLIYETTPAVLLSDGSASFDKTVDLAVIGELSSLSPDEILVDGLLSDDRTLDFESLSDIITYLADVRAVSGEVALGIVLPARVFLDAPTAAQIVTLCEYTDVPAIGINVAEPTTEDGAYYSVGDSCYPLRGSFGTYNLRAVIKASDEAASRGAYRSLADMGITNVQFSVYVENTAPSSGEPEPEPDETEPPIDERTNENAVTGDGTVGTDPAGEEPAESDPDAESEETTPAATEWGAGAAP